MQHSRRCSTEGIFRSVPALACSTLLACRTASCLKLLVSTEFSIQSLISRIVISTVFITAVKLFVGIGCNSTYGQFCPSDLLQLLICYSYSIPYSMFKAVDCSWSNFWTSCLRKSYDRSCRPSTKAHLVRRSSSDRLLMRWWYQRICCHQWKRRG